MRLLNQTTRILRTPNDGFPIIQKFSVQHGVWYTKKFVSERCYELAMRLPKYTGPRHPAEDAWGL